MQSKKFFYLLLVFLISYIKISYSYEIKEIPPQEFKNILTNEPNKIKLLYFFTSWCGICKKILPEVVHMHNAYDRDKLEVLFISLDDNDEILKKYLNSFKQLDIKVFRINQDDPRKVLKGMQEAGIIYHGSIPHFTLINSSGEIVVNGSYKVSGLQKGIEYLLKN